MLGCLQRRAKRKERSKFSVEMQREYEIVSIFLFHGVSMDLHQQVTLFVNRTFQRSFLCSSAVKQQEEKENKTARGKKQVQRKK